MPQGQQELCKLILAAENADEDALLLQQAFEAAGLAQAIHIVRSTAETIRFIGGEPPYDDRNRYPFPALLLLGFNIARPGGGDVLRWLQQNRHLKQRLPVVVLSSVECAEEMEAAYAWGASSYLVRPKNLDRLTALAANLGEYWLSMNRLPHQF